MVQIATVAYRLRNGQLLGRGGRKVPQKKRSLFTTKSTKGTKDVG